jgi:hypothetical protein
MKTKFKVISAALAAAIQLHPNLSPAGTVSTTADDGSSGSLRIVIQNAGNNEVITFGPAVTGTIFLTGGELQIKNNLSVVGPGGGIITVAGSSRIFHVFPGLTSVSISGLTISGGHQGNPGMGGGVFNESPLSLTACHLSGCSATGSTSGASGLGGGIFSGASLAMTACTVSYCGAFGGSGSSGSGLGGGLYVTGSLALTNCTLTWNEATGGLPGGSSLGGGLYCDNNFGAARVLVNCTVSGNQAGNVGHPYSGGDGGGIATEPVAGNLRLLNCLLLGNYNVCCSEDVRGSESAIHGKITSLGGNLFYSPIGSGYQVNGDGSVDYLGGSVDLVRLGVLKDRGGPTPTMSIGRDGPAFDNGNDLVAGPPYNLTADQRGFARLVGAHVDIGAYELGVFSCFTCSTIWLGGSGRWDFSSAWSGGAPGAGSSAFVTNSGTKTITMDNFTSTNFMSVSNLWVSAPTNSVNTLLLNAGPGTPFHVQDNFFVLRGGALTVSNSTVQMNSSTPPTNAFANNSSVIFDGPAAFYNNASLDTTHAFDLTVGNSAPGSLGMTNSTLNAYDVFVASGSSGTANFNNTTALLNRSLLIATSTGQTGIVNIIGGVFTATNAVSTNSPSLVMERGTAQMTISSGATVQFGSGLLGAFGGSATLSEQFANVSFSGPLQLENGTLNLPEGATLSLASSLILAAGSNSVAQVNNTGGTSAGGILNVTNGPILIGPGGSGLMTISRGTVTAQTVTLGGTTVGASGILHLTGTGTLNVSGIVGCDACGLGMNDGEQDGGTLNASTTSIIAGLNHNAQYNLSGGTAIAGKMFVGYSPGFTGTFTLTNGVMTTSNLFVGTTLGSTGVVSVAGGTLNVTNGPVLVGSGGSGQMTISQGTVTAQTVTLGGTTVGASGLLHLTGSGTLHVLGIGGCDACGFSNNDGEQDGGTLDASQTSIVIGLNHNAQYNLSGGTAIAGKMFVGYTPGFTGTYTQSGGTMTVTTNLIVGDCASNAVGVATLSGSAILYVTNDSHTAALIVRDGTFTMNGGTLVVDTLVVTNPCAHFVHNGGTLIYSQLILDPNLDADGDGVSNGLEQSLGMDPLNASFVCAPPGIVAWWPGAGNPNDIIGANNGTLQPGATYTAGKVGQGFSFDGVSGYVDFGTGVGNFGTSDFTAEFWIKTTSARIEYLLGKRPGCGHASFWDIRLDANGVLEANVDQDTLGNNYVDVISAHAVNNGAFHHVAMVRQGASLSLYVDGVLDGSSVGTGVAAISNSGSVTAGKDGCSGFNPSLHYFTGVLDEIALYTRALSAIEIQGIYTQGSAGKCLPPLYITSKSKSGNNFSVSWLAQEGLVYRAQYKANLNAATWTDVSGDVTATGASASKTDTPPPNTPQRFYRVEMLR